MKNIFPYTHDDTCKAYIIKTTIVIVTKMCKSKNKQTKEKKKKEKGEEEETNDKVLKPRFHAKT